MTYTAEQLRRDAVAIERMHGETLTVEWRDRQASLLRAHADALEENARLLAFRDYFADKCEGLFFQFGMEVIDLYNATHGSEVLRIEPDRADFPEETK